MASPSHSLSDQYKDLLKHWTEALNIVVPLKFYNAKKHSNDEVTALLESLTTDQHEDIKDMAFMKSLLSNWKIQEKKAKALSSKNVRTHSSGLFEYSPERRKKLPDKQVLP